MLLCYNTYLFAWYCVCMNIWRWLYYRGKSPLYLELFLSLNPTYTTYYLCDYLRFLISWVSVQMASSQRRPRWQLHPPAHVQWRPNHLTWCQAIIPGTCDSVIFHGKMNSAAVIKLRTLRWRDHPGDDIQEVLSPRCYRCRHRDPET